MCRVGGGRSSRDELRVGDLGKVEEGWEGDEECEVSDEGGKGRGE